MLLRSTTASISRSASGFVRPTATEPASAPTPDPGRFRLPSPVWAALVCASALLARIEVCCPTPVFHVRPFAILRPLLWPRLTSGDPSQHLSMSVALRQTARSPRVWRTHLPAYACRIYVAACRARTGLCIYWPAYPAAPPLSASCSSGQRFASSFLQIPPRDGHPCRSANTSPCRVCRGLSPPSECALPGAPKKGPASRQGLLERQNKSYGTVTFLGRLGTGYDESAKMLVGIARITNITTAAQSSNLFI